MALLWTQSLNAQSGYAYNAKKKGIFGLFGQNDNQNQASEKQTLFNVLKNLNKQKGVYFLFSDPSLGDKPVNAVADMQAAIDRILDQVLKNTGLKYKKVSDNTFVILNSKESSKKVIQPAAVNFENLQPVENKAARVSVNDVITGRITTAEGAPIAGVSVTVKGTRRGTSTNTNGEFSIDAKQGEVLVISSVGYSTQEVAVGSDARINLSLALADKSMSEIVVTAL